LDFKHGPSPELTLQHLLTEAGVIKKAKGPGLILVPWSEGSFKRGDWLERMADPGFRSGANAALKVVSTAGGVETYLLDKKGTPLDLEDEDDG
jgi:hypothetical protein